MAVPAGMAFPAGMPYGYPAGPDGAYVPVTGPEAALQYASVYGMYPGPQAEQVGAQYGRPLLPRQPGAPLQLVRLVAPSRCYGPFCLLDLPRGI